MTVGSWVLDAIGRERLEAAKEEASRRRLGAALGVSLAERLGEEDLRHVFSSLELGVFDALDDDDAVETLRYVSAQAFLVGRTLTPPAEPIERAAWLVRLGCLALLGERGTDFRRILLEGGIPMLALPGASWGDRVWAATLEIWLRLFRKNGWEDLDAVQARVAELRRNQAEHEPSFLRTLEERRDIAPALRLMAQYHLARAAELLAEYVTQGSADGRFDIDPQLDAQFDRALAACARGHLLEFENFVRLLDRAAKVLVGNSIWTVTRAVNSRVTQFVRQVVSRARKSPLFEMLPPQRRTLAEQGLLGSSHRAVVVSLPTSSGKTLIAEFRILQALNQFDQERGWVAYLAPTRALVNQLCTRLRRDFGPLGIGVERVSPVLEVDGLEASLLTNASGEDPFRVLVTTPEKLDLMLRGGWEKKIGRPLTLVVVDEAHNIRSPKRGIKLELLLATINRECRYAQFLLLTPFIPNAAEIASWLAPESCKDVQIRLEWSPNDRAIVLVRPKKGARRATFGLQMQTVHTTHDTLSIPEALELPEGRPLGLPWFKVSKSPNSLAAATAEVLRRRGSVIVLAGQPRYCWAIAKAFQNPEHRRGTQSEDVASIRAFFEREFGADFPLAKLLDYGVGVHHAGLSDEARALVEWLLEKGELDVVVATTTVAQGVNFPVSGVVMASHQYPYGEVMPPEDFWNIAGRAGRVDQGDLGIVALAAVDERRADALRAFVQRNVGALNSTLIDMVQEAMRQAPLPPLEKLSHEPAWSAFLQYLAHTYRQIGNHERFANEVEQVLRGTLGFRALRRSHPGWARELVRGVRRYAAKLRGEPLQLVDATGFSLESVRATLGRLAEHRISEDVWTPDLFGARRGDLRRMMGILLDVPELRENLKEATGGSRPDGDTLARIVCDWVEGRSLQEMARAHFSDGEGKKRDPVEAMTVCCQKLFGRLTQTASWGLAALQSLTFKERFEQLSEEEQRTLRNLPARVYYGVNSDEAVALRLLGVPRQAAESLRRELRVQPDEPLSRLRARLRGSGVEPWRKAMDDAGPIYHRVWAILEGERD